ncbi:hypothetical protein B0H12DRAFT_1164402 [Mycena haematopus]|nr:hypothetical protein B0H12DRAFT_1164402 [Mycena haematopus]
MNNPQRDAEWSEYVHWHAEMTTRAWRLKSWQAVLHNAQIRLGRVVHADGATDSSCVRARGTAPSRPPWRPPRGTRSHPGRDVRRGRI